MINSLFVQPRTPEDLVNLERFIQFVAGKQDELARMENNEARIGAIEGWAAGADVSISKEHIQVLLDMPISQNVEEIEALLLANDGKILRPDVKLALQTSLMLAAIYWTPELFLFYTSKEILKTLLTPAIGSIGVNLVDGITTFAAVPLGYPNQLDLVNNSLPSSIDNLHAIFRYPSYIAAHIAASKLLPHAAAPVKALLAKAGHIATEVAESEVAETACDFFDLMHGTSGDDERDAYLLEKYEGTLATSTSVSEFASILASDVSRSMKWLYSCLPGRKTASDSQQTDSTIRTTARLN